MKPCELCWWQSFCMSFSWPADSRKFNVAFPNSWRVGSQPLGVQCLASFC